MVAFPSKKVLQSMVDIGYQLKNHGVTLTISGGNLIKTSSPAYELDEGWVHITGVPHGFRHYLIFWGLGTIVGSTIEVDMLTFMKMGIVRVKVGISDKRQLPLTTDLVFGRQGLHITFTLEEDSFQPTVAPTDDIDPIDQDDYGADKGNAEELEMGVAAKKMKSDTSQSNTSTPQAKNAGSGTTPCNTKLR